MLDRSQGQRFTFNLEFGLPLVEGKENLPASQHRGRLFGGKLRGSPRPSVFTTPRRQQSPRRISLNTSLNTRMVLFQFPDLLSNKAQRETSVKVPSGLLCSVLMRCHSFCSVEEPPNLKLWLTTKEVLYISETSLAESRS